MGIRSAIKKVAGKAGDAVAKAAALSPEQLEEVRANREKYLTQVPDPNDPAQAELTQRLIAACAVEVHNAYLPQIGQLYTPVDPSAEYGERAYDPAHNIRFIQITKWVTDPDENDLEKLISVYDVLSNDDCNIALVFNRTKRRTNAYLAIADGGNSSDNVNADNYERRLYEAVMGNFPGSELLDGGMGRIPCLNEGRDYSVATVSNIPTEKSERFVSQTIEKLLDGIVPTTRREEYTIILLATPVLDVEERKLRLAELYTALAPYAGWQTDFHYTESDSTMSTATAGVNVGVSAGRQQGTNSSVSESDSETSSSNETTSQTESLSDTTTEGTSQSSTQGTSSSTGESASSSESESLAGTVGVKIPFINGSISKTGTTGETQGTSSSSGTSQSLSDTASSSTSRATSTAKALAQTLGKAATKGITTTSGVTEALSLGANFGANFSRASSVTATVGKSEGITQSFTNYAIKHALELLEAQMKRLDQASALGMWDFAAYVLSEDVNIANNVAHSYLALTQGEESFMTQAAVNVWRGDLIGEESAPAATICEYLRDLRHPLFGMDPAVLVAAPDFASYPDIVTATTALSGKELAYSLNFPRKSVSGLPVIECAEFGRSISKFGGRQEEGESIRLGKIFHMQHEERLAVTLERESFSSHCFVTGSTGAGKTNTVCKILDELSEQGVSFLVVEPAKGEYKDVWGGRDGVSVFGTNPALAPLLRINPFSFPEEMHVLEHLDRLIEIFNVCWPMYAAMPAVLKSAVEKSYEDCGWDLVESTNEFGPHMYPNFADVARNVRTILDTSEYDAENKGAYKGSLLTRLESLTNGINGMILTEDEVAPEVLFDSDVIVDISRVGSAETKSLLMGLLILKLQEHRMAHSQGMNAPLRHVTVLEEAHNILKRTSTEQTSEGANLLGKSVEMLSNAIAEMRTYGEGFVIADQAPGLLDMAAIRNTNTKIIMRLPDLSDRELVGRAAGLNDEQIAELARLPRGVAAVYQNDWVEPVLCKVDRAEDGERFSYERPVGASPSPDDDGIALDVADLLVKGTRVEPSQLRDIEAGLRRAGVCASTRAAVLRELKDPPAKIKVTKLAPVLSALFPGVKRSVVESVSREKDPELWTASAERALEALAGDELALRTRNVIIQGIITEHLLGELRDAPRYEDWYRHNGLW